MTSEPLIAKAQAKVSELAEDLRCNEVARCGPFFSAADEVRALGMLEKTYTWKRIALWEAVERLNVAVLGSVPFVGARLVRKRMAHDFGLRDTPTT